MSAVRNRRYTGELCQGLAVLGRPCWRGAGSPNSSSLLLAPRGKANRWRYGLVVQGKSHGECESATL